MGSGCRLPNQNRSAVIHHIFQSAEALRDYYADVQQCRLASTVFGVFLLLASMGGPRPPWCAHGIMPSSREESSTGAKCPDEETKGSWHKHTKCVLRSGGLGKHIQGIHDIVLNLVCFRIVRTVLVCSGRCAGLYSDRASHWSLDRKIYQQVVCPNKL